MLGLMMMGSMTASNVKFKTILEVSVKGSEDVVKIYRRIVDPNSLGF
jgi:PTS system mannose-specific IID component